LLAGLDGLATAEGRPSSSPLSFEELGVDAGLVAYRADVLLPDQEIDLKFEAVADRALVFVDGVSVGTVAASGSVRVHGLGRPSRLDVVVENLGRVNYGPHLGEHKGLLGPVLVERRMVQGWVSTPVELDFLRPGALEAIETLPSDGDAAGASTAVFDLAEPLDTHLALPGFEKGFAWVNGFLLGRYWSVGPQQTLYVPAPLLRTGRNTVTILELHTSGDRIELRPEAELGPTEQYIEEF
jgi:beta-galactosidase